MNSALESTLAVGALTLVLVSGGGGGKANPLQVEDSPAQARLLAREGRPPAGPRRREVQLLFLRSHYDDERRLGWDAQDHRHQGD
jgi:hypothetical protein